MRVVADICVNVSEIVMLCPNTTEKTGRTDLGRTHICILYIYMYENFEMPPEHSGGSVEQVVGYLVLELNTDV